MELWARLRYLEVSWTGLALMVGAFVAVALVRRALPPNRRQRGRISVFLLGAAPILHLLATAAGLAGAPSVSAAIHLANILLVIVGASGVVGLLVFDVALGRSTLPTIVRDLTQVAAFALILFLVLRLGGINPLSVITTSAVVTAVVGLALQGLLSNVMAGLVLQIDRTFSLGDWIQLGARIGKIVEINWRYSTLLTRDGDTALVPNTQLVSSEVLNLSRPTRGRRSVVTVPFHNAHAPREVERVVLAAIADVSGVVREPPPTCAPHEFARGTVIYAVTYWVEDVAKETAIAGEVRARLWYAAEKERLDGPCPQPARTQEARAQDDRAT